MRHYACSRAALQGHWQLAGKGSCLAGSIHIRLVQRPAVAAAHAAWQMLGGTLRKQFA